MKNLSQKQEAYMLKAQIRLLEASFSSLISYNKKVLHIACGDTSLSPFFTRKGFDYTGIDARPQCIQDIREKNIPLRHSLHITNTSALPFDDNSFDYVVLWNASIDRASSLESIFTEAVRVASSSFIYGAWNKYSLHSLCKGSAFTSGSAVNSQKTYLKNSCFFVDKELFQNPFLIKRRLRLIAGYPIAWEKSVQLLPLATKKIIPLKPLLLPTYFGTFFSMRVDFTNIKPLTSHPLHIYKPQTDSTL